jgi:hypothetical protein
MPWKADTKHTTGKEVDFLRELGTYKQDDKGLTRRVATPKERLALLEGYKKSMDLRFDWKSLDMDIDPAKVAAALEEEIAKTKAEIAANSAKIN